MNEAGQRRGAEALPEPMGRGLFRGHPRGLGPLFFAEMWERFSYYGMRALLVLFMVAPASEGGLGLGTAEAALIYGNYAMAVYMLSIPGGFVADRMLGAQRAVAMGGVLIALGHFTLAVPSTAGFYSGLILVALGTGLFKPNISALVGSLYGPGDTRRDAGFSLFYMGINIGGFFSPLITGFLAQSAPFKSWLATQGFDPAESWHWGFAAAGVGMTFGLANFFLRGRPFREGPAVVPPDAAFLQQGGLVLAGTGVLMALAVLSDQGGFEWIRYLFLVVPIAAALWFGLSPEQERRRFGAVMVFFIAAMVFWAIFEQAGVTIALFADQLTRTEFLGVAFPSAWFQSLNPLFVIALSPMFAVLWLRLGSRQPSSAIKFVLGLVCLASSFLLLVPAAALTAAGKVSPLWLAGMFFLQTVGELLLSPVGLSTMTKLAPVRLVGFVLGIWFLGAALGNKLAGVLGSGFTASEPEGLAAYFLWQAAWVGVAAIALLALTPWVKKLMAGAE